jgi:hypothetical protein
MDGDEVGSYRPISNLPVLPMLFARMIARQLMAYLHHHRVRSENVVRPIGTERCGTGRAFGKSCQIDLIVLRISERLPTVMMELQAATNLSRDPYGIVCYVCLCQSIKK